MGFPTFFHDVFSFVNFLKILMVGCIFFTCFSNVISLLLVSSSESVVPSSGTFHVKLPKRRGVELGITISGR